MGSASRLFDGRLAQRKSSSNVGASTGTTPNGKSVQFIKKPTIDEKEEDSFDPNVNLIKESIIK